MYSTPVGWDGETVAWRELCPGVWQRPLISPETGARQILMGEVRIEPGAVLPLHYHDVEDAVLVQAGDGQIEIDGERHPLRAGRCYLIPPNVRHRLTNTGTEPIQIIFGFPTATPARYWAEETAGSSR